MKSFLFHFIILAFASNLKAEDELFSFGAKLHFSNTIDKFYDATQTYVRFAKPKLSAEASVLSNVSEYVAFELAFTSSEKSTCSTGLGYLKTARVTLAFNKIFSLDIGCLKLEQGGWLSRKENHFSPFDTGLNHQFWNKKYNKALNLNLNFMGTARVQLIEDDTADAQKDKKGQVALNFAWIIDLFGAKPIFQLGFYNAFKAFHYTIGIKGSIGDLHIRTDFTRDHFVKSQASLSKISEEQVIFLKYKAYKLLNPYFRYHSKTTKTNDITKENSGKPLDDSSWKNSGTTLSFGNSFKLSKQISSYINMDLKWGKFINQKKNQNKWAIRLGLKGRI